MADIGKLSLIVSASDDLSAGFSRIESNVQGFANRTKGTLSRAFGATGIKQMEGAFKALTAVIPTDQFSQIVDDFKEAQKLGVSPKFLAGLKRAAGGDADAAVAGMKALERVIANVEISSEDAGKGLAEFGFDLRKLQALSKEEQFLAIVRAYSALTDETKRTELGTAAFSKKYFEMIPLLEKGAEAIKTAGDEMERFGLVVGKDQAKQVMKAAGAIKQIKLGFEGIKTQIAIAIAPAVESIGLAFQKIIDGPLKIFLGMIQSIGSLLAQIKEGLGAQMLTGAIMGRMMFGGRLGPVAGAGIAAAEAGGLINEQDMAAIAGGAAAGMIIPLVGPWLGAAGGLIVSKIAGIFQDTSPGVMAGLPAAAAAAKAREEQEDVMR